MPMCAKDEHPVSKQNKNRVAVATQGESHAATISSPSLFPLKLTPFEFFFLCDDRDAYRGVIPIEVIAEGDLDEEILDRAFSLAQIRHPLLSARVDDDQKSWPCWSLGEPQRVIFEGGPVDVVEIDPQLSAGVQLRVRRDGQRVRLLFAFRHLAVDGLGAFQFISDVFVAYAHFSTGGSGSPAWHP